MRQETNQMLNIIMDSSRPMPEYVFRYFLDAKKKPEEKIFYNLIADSFLTLFSYCKLMFEHAWSQAFAILRVGIEQVAKVYILATIPEALEQYINIHNLRAQFSNIKTEEEKKAFFNAHHIQKNKIYSFFDYGWIAKFTSDGKYGRDQLIKLARLDEFLVDIENSLNRFAHGSLSVFQMSKDNWAPMGRYGERANLTCCKLYDFLTYSYCKIIGREEFDKLPLSRYFWLFKEIYQELFEREGWIK